MIFTTTLLLVLFERFKEFLHILCDAVNGEECQWDCDENLVSQIAFWLLILAVIIAFPNLYLVCWKLVAISALCCCFVVWIGDSNVHLVNIATQTAQTAYRR